MNPDTDIYRPFFNRRLPRALRELLANRHSVMTEAAQLTMRRFSGSSSSLDFAVPAGGPRPPGFVRTGAREM